jgi:hypothetical protein
MFTVVRHIAHIIKVPDTNVKVTSRREEKSKFVYGDHLVIIYRWTVTQMIPIMTTSVTHVIQVYSCKVKVIRDDQMFRYFPEYCPEHISIMNIYNGIIMPTSLSKELVMGVFCDDVALVCESVHA